MESLVKLAWREETHHLTAEEIVLKKMHQLPRHTSSINMASIPQGGSSKWQRRNSHRISATASFEGDNMSMYGEASTGHAKLYGTVHGHHVEGADEDNSDEYESSV